MDYFLQSEQNYDEQLSGRITELVKKKQNTKLCVCEVFLESHILSGITKDHETVSSSFIKVPSSEPQPCSVIQQDVITVGGLRVTNNMTRQVTEHSFIEIFLSNVQ